MKVCNLLVSQRGEVVYNGQEYAKENCENMPKIVFFDIDGTIWDEKMEIPHSTVETIQQLKDKGHKTFICSGRGRANIRSKKLLSLGFDGIIASCGNHIEMDGEIIYQKLLPQELIRRAIQLLEENHMPVVLEGPTYHWVDEDAFADDPFVDYIREEMGEFAVPITGYEGEYVINKFSADIMPDTNFENVQKALENELDFLVHPGAPFQVVEFIPKGTSKATGIQKVCELLGVDVADTYAIGDSVNDLDMLTFVGHGIAMGNGTPVAKEAAEYVTTGIKEDGIKHAMEHYGLI